MKQSESESINILIIDDHLENVELLASTLEQENLKLFTTTSTRNAISICKEFDISIALIDVKMPEMDGFELLEILKANPQTQDIIVVLVTGYSMGTEDVLKGLNAGAVDYLFKPMDIHITRAKVNSLIKMVKHEREIRQQNHELERYQQSLYSGIEKIQKDKVTKENFLANMSHEIRSPLNGIMGLLALLKETTNSPDQKEILDLMEYSSRSLLGIVNDVLDSAQLDAGKILIQRTRTDVKKLVRSVSDIALPLAQDKKLDIVCDIDPNIPDLLMADSLRLTQIITNLVNNSVKFTRQGAVIIKVELKDKTEDVALLEFIIKDTGIGISQSDLKDIFNRFEQIGNKSWQKFGGSGLGLSIVKRLVELKGGTLSVESIVGTGTTFKFINVFALAKAEIDQSIQKTQISALPKFEEIVILLADDNTTSQYVILRMLKEWNIRVEIASNGLEAFEKLCNNKFDLILMDTHMPIMDGIEATKKIRQELKSYKGNIPIISYSASVMASEKERAKKAGVSDFIDKPFEPEILNNKIRKLIFEAKPH